MILKEAVWASKQLSGNTGQVLSTVFSFFSRFQSAVWWVRERHYQLHLFNNWSDTERLLSRPKRTRISLKGVNITVKHLHKSFSLLLLRLSQNSAKRKREKKTKKNEFVLISQFESNKAENRTEPSAQWAHNDALFRIPWTYRKISVANTFSEKNPSISSNSVTTSTKA